MLVLHGGGETGSPQVTPANATNITANRSAIVWATRREPAYVVAPQLPGRTSQWTEPAIQASGDGAASTGIAETYPIDTRPHLPHRALARRRAARSSSSPTTPGSLRGLRCSPPRGRRTTTCPSVAKFATRADLVHARRRRPGRARTRAASTWRTRSRRAGTRVVARRRGRATTPRARRRTAPPKRAARRLLARARPARSLALFTTYIAGHRRRQPPLLVGADVRDGRDARLAVRAGPCA